MCLETSLHSELHNFSFLAHSRVGRTKPWHVSSWAHRGATAVVLDLIGMIAVYSGPLTAPTMFLCELFRGRMILVFYDFEI